MNINRIIAVRAAKIESVSNKVPPGQSSGEHQRLSLSMAAHIINEFINRHDRYYVELSHDAGRWW